MRMNGTANGCFSQDLYDISEVSTNIWRNSYKSMGPPWSKLWEVDKSSGFFRLFFGARNHGSALTSHRLDPFFFFVSFRVSLLRKRITASSVSTRCRKRLAGLLLCITFPPALALKAGLASAYLTPCCNKGHETSVSKSSQKWTALKVPKKNTVACQLPVPFLLIHSHGQPLVTDCLTHYIDVFRCVLGTSWMNSFRRLEKRELGAKSFHKTIGSCPRPLFRKSA